MTVRILQERASLRDPHDCTDQADDLALLEAVFDALVRRGRDNRFHPALAEAWTVSDDCRTWTFQLREGLKFHDGAPVDAHVAARSIARMQRPDIGATLGAPAVWAAYLGDAEIAATDTRTLRIQTAKPIADLLDILVSGYVLPPDQMDDPGFAMAPVGTGAYRVAEAEDDRVVLQANDHWHGGRPANQRLLIEQETSEAARREAVAKGAAQIVTRLAPNADVGSATLTPYLDPVAIVLLFNCAAGPLTDPGLRRALNLAIDREALIRDVLDGAGQPLEGFMSPAHYGAEKAPAPFYDLEAAKALLPESLTLTLDRPETLPDEAAPLCDWLANALSDVGITIDIRAHADRVAYAERVRDKQIGDMCVFDSSPMSAFRVLAEKLDGRSPGAWAQGYNDDQVNGLIDEARATPEDNAREAVYREAYGRLRQNPAWLTLYNRVRAIACAGNSGGAQTRPDGILDFTSLPPQ